jgi:hypothetical protein
MGTSKIKISRTSLPSLGLKENVSGRAGFDFGIFSPQVRLFEGLSRGIIGVLETWKNELVLF